MVITLAVFSIEGKMLEEKEILNIPDTWLEISFLSNFNALVGILLGPADLLESMALSKKEILNLFLRKSEKCLCQNEILSFILLAIEEK